MDNRQYRRGDVGVAIEEWDWPKEFDDIISKLRSYTTLAEGAYAAGDYGQCRAFLREIEALCWAARGEAAKRGSIS